MLPWNWVLNVIGTLLENEPPLSVILVIKNGIEKGENKLQGVPQPCSISTTFRELVIETGKGDCGGAASGLTEDTGWERSLGLRVSLSSSRSSCSSPIR